MDRIIIIRGSKTQGKGIFAVRLFKKDERIFRFASGWIKIDHKPGCHCVVCKRCIQVGRFKWLSPEKRSYGWYLNHHCEPSCGIKGTYIVALRNIKPGEEITVDYAITNADRHWNMKCQCKSRNCRAVIRSIQFLPFRLYLKYQRYIPRYVKTRYREH